MIIEHGIYIDTEGLTEEQLIRLKHHINVSRQVFTASVKGMLKGVQKYGPEPEPVECIGAKAWPTEAEKGYQVASAHWLPHIFSEAVDAANQTALFADALGVQLDSDAG